MIKIIMQILGGNYDSKKKYCCVYRFKYFYMCIYGLYWFVVLTDDTNRMLENAQNETSGGMALLFTIITCGIYGLYWMYKEGEKIDRIKTSRGIPSSNSGILYLILGLVGFSIISYALIQNELNNLQTA